MFHERKWKKWKKIKMRVRRYKTLIHWQKWRLYVYKKKMLPEKMEGFPILYDKIVKVFKEKDFVQNAWNKVAESLDFCRK